VFFMQATYQVNLELTVTLHGVPRRPSQSHCRQVRHHSAQVVLALQWVHWMSQELVYVYMQIHLQ
jgi:hypothetical protein